VLKTLAKRPEQRYPSVEALALDLERYRQGKPVLARPQSVGYRLQKYTSRHRWALGTALMVTLVLSASLAVVAWQARQAVHEANRVAAMRDFVTGLFETAGNAPRGATVDLRALLDAAIVRGNRELALEPQARAEVFGMVARLRLGLGDDREAMALLQRQAAILDSLGDVPTSLRLEAVTLRGHAELQLGQRQACIDTMQPWLATARREQAQLSPQVAEFYSRLARCRRALGERNTARQLFERSLALRRDTLDDEVGVVENLVDLANLHADADEPAEAMRKLRAALLQLQQQVGYRHPLAIEIQRRIGMLQREQSNTAGAAQAFDAALSLAIELLGEHHPTTLALRRQRAGVYMEQGWFDTAERELRSTNRLLIERLGDRHVDVGSSFHTLGKVAWERGNLEAALGDLKRAVAIWRGSTDATLLSRGLADYAQALNAAGRRSEAMQAIAEARAVRVAQLGKDNPQVGDIDRIHGEMLAANGEHAEAIERLGEAVRLTTGGYGPSDVRTRHAELAFAREQARNDEDVRGQVLALAKIEALAALPQEDLASRKLRWRARAYAAEAHCRGGAAARGRDELRAIERDLQQAMPEGGLIPREVAALQAACDVLATR
jgi:serine/threonine-protein kinase